MYEKKDELKEELVKSDIKAAITCLVFPPAIIPNIPMAIIRHKLYKDIVEWDGWDEDFESTVVIYEEC